MRWLQKAQQNGSLGLVHVATSLMVADIFTKALSFESFARHASYLKGRVFPQMKAKSARKRKATDECKE